MRKYLVYWFMATLSIGLWSCNDKDPQPVVALKSVTIIPYDNAVGYACKGNYNSFELTNTDDKVPMFITTEELKKSTLTAETTIGINTQAYYNGQAIGSEGVTVDATQPIQIEVKGYDEDKTYTINVVQATETSEDELVIAKSTDMKKMGIDENVVDYTVAYFNNKFYCFTTGLKDKIAQYKVYSSENGVKWNEISYLPHELGALGGFGARALAFNDRLYLLGGARTLGDDEWGISAETVKNISIIKYWRSFSTADGQTFKCDTIGVKGTWKISSTSVSNTNLPNPSTFVNAINYNNKIYFKNNYTFAFGSLAALGAFMQTEDGVNWTKLPSDANVTVRRQDAFFAFNGKLWSIGGFKSYISTSKNNGQSSVYSSSDNGQTWTLEAEDAGIGSMWGMTPVCGTNAVYLVGGEYIENGERVLSDKIYRSTDCIHWEAIKTGSKYTARRCPQMVVKGQYAYIFGGYTTVSTSNYGYDVKAIPAFDTYIFELK